MFKKFNNYNNRLKRVTFTCIATKNNLKGLHIPCKEIMESVHIKTILSSPMLIICII